MAPVRHRFWNVRFIFQFMGTHICLNCLTEAVRMWASVNWKCNHTSRHNAASDAENRRSKNSFLVTLCSVLWQLTATLMFQQIWLYNYRSLVCLWALDSRGLFPWLSPQQPRFGSWHWYVTGCVPPYRLDCWFLRVLQFSPPHNLRPQNTNSCAFRNTLCKFGWAFCFCLSKMSQVCAVIYFKLNALNISLCQLFDMDA